jgi:hypothetical protein
MFDTIVPTKSVSFLNLDLCGGYSPAALPMSARLFAKNVAEASDRHAMYV